MHLELVQRNKELFAAEFDVVENGATVGSACLQGKLSTFDANITIRYQENEMTLTPGKSGLDIIASKPYRPYTIAFNANKKGLISQTSVKTGFLSSIDYHQIELGTHIYEMYPIGFGNDGAKNPIYTSNRQIGLIEKDFVVINDLHTYMITCVDDYSALISLLFAAYMYLVAAYKPGVAVTQSVHKAFYKTTNKTLLQKYDPSFKSLYYE